MARSRHLGAGAVEPGRAYSADHGDSERMGRGHQMVIVEFCRRGGCLVRIRAEFCGFWYECETRFSTGSWKRFHGDQEVGWWRGWVGRMVAYQAGCLKATDGRDGRRWESGAGSGAAAASAVRRVTDATFILVRFDGAGLGLGAICFW